MLKLNQLKIKKTKEINMSRKAIENRLFELEQLYQLSMSLLRARPIASSSLQTASSLDK
jgi:phosphate uptake regulator